ncbi:MAG: DUF4102 domain-containing protein [Alphaproteobacteria bacterium]|nr:DUF4102 domain-containing protein [Alphaproteobacteria bacterium]
MLTDAVVKRLNPRARAYKVSDRGGLYLFVTASGGRHLRY